jgi:hypothetical protein
VKLLSLIVVKKLKNGNYWNCKVFFNPLNRHLGRFESSEKKDSQELGHLLEFENKTELIVSSKLIEGNKKEKLKKNFVCLKKVNGKYVVQSVIEEKISFNKRPQPLSPKTLEEKIKKVGVDHLESKKLNF